MPLPGWEDAPAAALVGTDQGRETKTASRGEGKGLLASRNQNLSNAAALVWLNANVLDRLVLDQLERA